MTVGVIQKLRDGLAWGQEAQRIINYGLALIRDASTTVQGLVRLATNAETTTGTATDIATTPAGIANLLSGKAALQTYAEGTFTPGLAFGGASVGITYSSQSGVYTRIGRVVEIGIQVTLSAKGSSTGAATITGLPFTVGSGISQFALSVNAMTAGVGDTHLQAIANASATTITLSDISAGGTVDLTEADFTNTSRIRIGGVYRI